MKKKTKDRLVFAAGWSYILLILALIYVPIIFLIIYSFISSRSLTGTGGTFTFQLYAKLFQNEAIMSATATTLIIAVSASLISTLLGTISAVGIYYMKRMKTAVNALTQVTVVNAEIITAVGFLLLFTFLRQIHLPIPRGYPTLIITHTVITLPYVILSVTPRLSQLNPNLYEAGLDLGASPFKTMFTVVLPQLIPGMISGFALSFTLSLDDFIISQYNKGSGLQTISTLIYAQMSKGSIASEFRALSALFFVVIMLALIVINLVARRNAARVYGKNLIGS